MWRTSVETVYRSLLQFWRKSAYCNNLFLRVYSCRELSCSNPHLKHELLVMEAIMAERDDFFEGKRPWSLIKDRVLQEYMSPYIAKVNHLGYPILLIDGYAGPGVFDDRKAGSPLIICRAATKYAQGNYKPIFITKNKENHNKLERVWLKANRSSPASPT